MEYLLVYDRQYRERAALIAQLKDSTARLSDASLDLRECEEQAEVKGFLEGKPPLDLAVMEIAEAGDVALSRDVRGLKQDLEMMLVAEPAISPMEYMTPDIRACSLLLRPCSLMQMKQVVRGFLENYFRSRESGDAEASLVMETREGKITLSYSSIYYIEVRGKKLFVRLQDKEYTMYESLENVRKILPGYFMQSHRSFVFNTRFLERVRLSENMIYLRNDIMVPLSRSFKSKIKELLDV